MFVYDLVIGGHRVPVDIPDGMLRVPEERLGEPAALLGQALAEGYAAMMCQRISPAVKGSLETAEQRSAFYAQLQGEFVAKLSEPFADGIRNLQQRHGLSAT
jgi:hypothetical protein